MSSLFLQNSSLTRIFSSKCHCRFVLLVVGASFLVKIYALWGLENIWFVGFRKYMVCKVQKTYGLQGLKNICFVGFRKCMVCSVCNLGHTTKTSRSRFFKLKNDFVQFAVSWAREQCSCTKIVVQIAQYHCIQSVYFFVSDSWGRGRRSDLNLGTGDKKFTVEDAGIENICFVGYAIWDIY